MKLYAMAALLGAAACADPGVTPDDGDDASVDPGVVTVTAHEAVTFRGADGTDHVRPTDLNRAVVQALVPGDAGGWRVLPGEGDRDGNLHVDGVPRGGPALLRVHREQASIEEAPRNEYFWIDVPPESEDDGELALDLGTWQAGRPDVEFATEPTPVTLEVSGLAPWDADFDLLYVYAPNNFFVNVFNDDFEGSIEGMPTGGDTSADVFVDWMVALGAPLFDPARQDRATAMQLRFREMDGVFVAAPVRGAALPAFTIDNATAVDIAVPLAEPASFTVQVAMDRAAFDILADDIHPDVGPVAGRGWGVESSPSDVAVEFSRESLPAEIVVVDPAGLDGGGLFDLGPIEVVSPLPAESHFLFAITAWPVPMIRDDGFFATGYPEIGVYTPSLPTAAAPAAPLVGPVRDITIDGRDAAAGVEGAGLEPVIAWTAPALGTPTGYELSVLEPGFGDPRYEHIWRAAATFHLPGTATELRLPPEVLQADRPYILTIRATSNALDPAALARAPRHLALPYGWADAFTPAFRP